MTPHKTIAVLLKYKVSLTMAGYKAERNGLPVGHALWMVGETIAFCEQNRMEKAFRWLGFIQGVLWTQGIHSIDELKEHNMTPAEEFKQ